MVHGVLRKLEKYEESTLLEKITITLNFNFLGYNPSMSLINCLSVILYNYYIICYIYVKLHM